MNVLIFLIPAALALGGLGLAAFIWSVKAGQYEDLDGAAARALLDDDEDEPPQPSRAFRKVGPSTGSG